MILPIIKYGSSVLRSKASIVGKGDDFKNFSENMFETLKQEQGIGLAGPQVNVLKNLFIIDTTPFADDETPQIEKAFFNPEIIYFGDIIDDFEEGCLSIPGIFENVKRPSTIEVRYRDINFDIKNETLEGIEARIFQHEYDHLEGILFVDRIHKLKRKLINKKLQHIVKNSH